MMGTRRNVVAADQRRRVVAAFPQFSQAVAPDGASGPRSRIADSFGAALLGSEHLQDFRATGSRHYFAFPDSFAGILSHMHFHQDAAMEVAGNSLLKVHFKLSGNNTVRFADGDDINRRGGCLLVAVHPCGITKLDAHSEDAFEHSLTFACAPQVLTEKLGLDPDALPEPFRSFELGRELQAHVHSAPLTARMTQAIHEMLTCPYAGRFSHLHAEARAIDLICMALHAFDTKPERGDVRLTPRDVTALGEIRDCLDARFMDPPTIAEIARTAGMNRTKVTQGFRYLFDQTILEYCQRLRMQRARELLLGGVPVGTVAIDVGYEHHSSFAHAFRTYFGYSPVEVRRNRPAR